MQVPTRVYFDNAATTPLHPAAFEAMQPYLQQFYGNPSSPYAVGRKSRTAVDSARAQVAALVGAEPDEIVFTSGGTESDNWALMGVGFDQFRGGRHRQRRHIILSEVEHHAVSEAANTLKDIGFVVSLARVDGDGRVNPDEVARLLRVDTLLVSVMTVNNEIGTMQPIAEISAVIKAYGDVLFHTDAIQAAGKIDLAPVTAAVDLLSVSAHKFGGPKGTGALFVKRGVRLSTMLPGGSQERGRRAGTENVAGLVGFGQAAEQARACLDANSAKLTDLRLSLESGLRQLPSAHIHGTGALRAPHIISVALDGHRAESVALSLDLKGIAVGTGPACASGAVEPSHVLAAIGCTPERARDTLRISVGVENTLEEVHQLLDALREIVKQDDVRLSAGS